MKRVAPAVLYYLAAVVLGVLVVASSLDATEHRHDLFGFQSAEEKTDTLLKTWAERLTFGAYRGASAKSSAREAVLHDLERSEARARAASIGLVVLSALFLAVQLRTRVGGRLGLAGNLLGVSAVFLAVGLVAPVLTVSAGDEVAILGRVIVQHDTKSILGTIEELFATDNVFLGVMIALFSVVAPVLKVVLGVAAIAARRWRRHATAVLAIIGRWSMTDVFVVAVLLAFLAADTDQFTDASVDLGLYFFTGYAILSLLAGHLLLHHGDTEETP